MKTLDLPVDAIDVGQRLRAVSEGWIQILAASIEERGLINPITVGLARDGRYPLIAGAHRLAAVRQIGWLTIPAISLATDALGKRMIELQENVFRRDLNPIDRAAHLGELKRVWDLLYPEQKHGAKGLAAIMQMRADAAAKRPGGQNVLLDEDSQNQGVADGGADGKQGVLSFREVASEQLGLTKRHINRFTSIFQNLQPDVAAAVSTLPIAERLTEVMALSRLTPSEQRQVAAVLAEHPALTSVAKIVAALDPENEAPQLSRAERADNALRAAWRTAPESVRKSFLRHLAATGAIERLLGRTLFDEAPASPLTPGKVER